MKLWIFEILEIMAHRRPLYTIQQGPVATTKNGESETAFIKWELFMWPICVCELNFYFCFWTSMTHGWSKMRFLGVLLSFLFISDQKMPKKPLWNFWHFLVPDTLYSSEIVQNGFPRGYFWFCIHYWWEQAKKMILKLFGWKGGRCFSHIIGSRVVQNAVFGGFTQFSIHF